MPGMWIATPARVARSIVRRADRLYRRMVSPSLQEVRRAFHIEHLERAESPVRALPALLPPRSGHLVDAILRRAGLDGAEAEARRDSVPVRAVPMQFRELSGL